jgi:hypothetical protein
MSLSNYFPLQLTDMEFTSGAGWDDLTLRLSDFAMQCNKLWKVTAVVYG